MKTLTDIKSDFPILNREVNNRSLVYLDNAASSQKPKQVIDVIENYYRNLNSNVHRGVHTLSQLATDAYEDARNIAQRFINAEHNHEIIFTAGTTQSINTVAYSLEQLLNECDEIIISEIEHHANIVPWQIIAKRKKLNLKYIPLTKAGTLDLQQLPGLITSKTKLIAVNHVSNALGVITPVKEIISLARENNIKVLLDGAQAVAHLEVDVQKLDCDFYVFSGHKICGSTGVGVLYGKEQWLNEMPPFLGGGDMIKTVTMEKTEFNDLPHKFEAGTPNIAGVIGMGAGIKYMQEVGFDTIHEIETELHDYARAELLKIEGLKIYGDVTNKVSVISFNVEGIHSYDLGVILDKLGVAVRTGHHCTQPVMQYFDIAGTVRASFAFYNTKEDADRLIEAVTKAVSMLS